MYIQFYGFKEKPFKLTPDPDFFYHSPIHRQALAHLTYGLEDKQGFIVLTGEIGAGKTTVIQVLLNNLKDTTKVARINNTKVTSLQLLEMIVQDFGLKIQGSSKTELLDGLNRFLLEQHALGNYALLIVDEAQNFSTSLLEEIRLLSNLETGKEKLVQIILSGQPELGYKLRSPQLRQLAQRITISFHMTGLDRKETEGYINYRLQVAGSQNRALFTPKAIDQIAEFSKGIPRMINIICDAALLTGFVTEQRQIDEAIIREVIQELKTTQYTSPEEGKEPSPQKVQKTMAQTGDVFQTMPLLEKKLDDLGGKLEQACRTLSQLEQKISSSLERRPPPEVLSLQRNASKERFNHIEEEDKPQEEGPRPGILHELMTNSGHFPAFASLLKINLTSLFWYGSDITNLALWVGTFLQAGLLSLWKRRDRIRGMSTFLGNLISPLIYSSSGFIFEGSPFFQRSELLVFWGYSLIIGLLQAVQVQLGGMRAGVINFFEVSVRVALIPVLYVLYGLEKENKNITLSAFQEVFAELLKNPIQAYLVEAFILLSVLYGLNRVLKTQTPP